VQYDFETVGQALIAKLRGELDLHTSPQFKEQLAKIFTTHPQMKYLIMDVQHLQFIDSSGLGVILGRYRELEERGGRLFFCTSQSAYQAGFADVRLSKDL